MQALRSLALVAFLAGIGLLAIGFVVSSGNDDNSNARDVEEIDLRATATATSTVAEATASDTSTAQPSATPVPTATPVPYDGEVARMKIPVLKVDYPIEYLGLIPGANQLDTPHNATGAIGWYKLPDYGKPGFGSNSVFSAHVNYNGKNGPFFNLYGIKGYDDIIVTMDDGREYHYQVFSVHRYVIDERFAQADQKLIDMGWLISAPDKPKGEEWITLITCSCEPGRVINVDRNGFGECVDRDVVVAKRVS